MFWWFFRNSGVVPVLFWGILKILCGFFGNSEVVLAFFCEFRCFSLGIPLVFWEFRGCSAGFLGIPGLFRWFFGNSGVVLLRRETEAWLGGEGIVWDFWESRGFGGWNCVLEHPRSDGGRVGEEPGVTPE